MPDQTDNPKSAESPSPILLPDVPALAVAPGSAALVTPEGEFETWPEDRARSRYNRQRFLVCHSVFSGRRMGVKNKIPLNWHFDVLELFAFVRPASFCLPTPHGLARILSLPGSEAPHPDLDDQAMFLMEAARTLLTQLTSPRYPHRAETRRTALAMKSSGASTTWVDPSRNGRL